MNLTRPTDVQAILRDLGMRPSKVLGQNFLIDRNILDIFIRAAELASSDAVLEIGPGLGVVTGALLPLARHVTAIEKHRGLFQFLQQRFAGAANLELLHADALDLDLKVLASRADKMISNLPYSVGSRILVECFLADPPPGRIVVTVQEEVAQRLAAPPHDAQRGLLGVWAQLVYDVRLVKRVSPTCFWPAPDVTSAIVALTRNARPPLAPDTKAAFFGLTRHAFTFRRKQMATVLRRAPDSFGLKGRDAPRVLGDVGIEAASRPETLTVDQWIRLSEVISRGS